MLPTQPLKTYIVEDSRVIRENLIATLEELVPVEVVGTAEDEASAVRWLGDPGNHADLLIVDIFLKAGTGLGVLRAANVRPRGHRVWCSATTPRRTCAASASNWVLTGCSTSPTRSMRSFTTATAWRPVTPAGALGRTQRSRYWIRPFFSA